jgi:Flp pilus assembly protein TadG
MHSGVKKTKLNNTFKRLLKNESGNVAQILGFMAVPLCMAMGLAVDTARLTGEQTSFHGAVDAAVIAIAADARSANSDAATITTLKEYAKKYLEANYLPSNSSATNVNISGLTIVGETITLNATATFPTAFGRFVGLNTINLESMSEAKKSGEGGVELTLVMDTTGSMAWDADGNTTALANSRITAAKNAAKTLLDTIYAGNLTSVGYKTNIRVSLVPFAAAVRLDTAANDYDPSWIDTNGSNPLSAGQDIEPGYWSGSNKKGNLTWHPEVITNYDKFAAWGGGWTGCVEARASTVNGNSVNFNESDDAPTGSNTKFPAYYNFDNSDHDSNCATAPIVPMTYNRAHVVSGIDAMTASGNTVIPEGLAWGWRTLSPGAPYTTVEQMTGISTTQGKPISPYHDQYWKKVIVLMTDGDNALNGTTHNGTASTVYSAYGYSNEADLNLNRFGVQTGSSGTAQTELDKGVIGLCTNMKSQGVEVYVTGFGTGISGTSLANLKSCATDAAHYTNATTNAALQAFFQQIGTDINNNALYVSK